MGKKFKRIRKHVVKRLASIAQMYGLEYKTKDVCVALLVEVDTPVSTNVSCHHNFDSSEFMSILCITLMNEAKKNDLSSGEVVELIMEAAEKEGEFGAERTAAGQLH